MTTSHRAPRKVARLRWLLPALLVLFWLFVVGPLGQFAGRLGEVQENDNAGFLPASAEATQVLNLSERFNPEDDVLPTILIFEAPAELTDEQLAAIEDDVAMVAEADGVIGDPFGPIVSEDGEAAFASLPLDGTDGLAISETVNDIRAELDEGAAVAAGVDTYVTGPGGFLADFGEAFGEIDGLLLLTTLGVVLLILLIVYRSPILPFVVLFSSVLALGGASAVIYVLADQNVLDLNGQSQGILFILVIGAATDYALLLVSRFREELRRHHHRFDAMRAALKGTYEAILASGGTVVLGVLMFLLSDLTSIQGLGPVAAIGVVFAMLASLTFLPAVLALLGRVAFWPFRPHYGSAPTEVRGTWGRIARLVGRRYRYLLLGTAAVLIALAAFAPTFKADGVAQSDFFLTSVDSTEGQAALERHFPAGQGSETIIVTQAGDLEAVVEAASEVDGVAEVTPVLAGPAIPPDVDPADLPPDLPPEALEPQPLVVDGLVQIQVVLEDAADSDEAELSIVALREALDPVSYYALVGGSTAIQYDTQVASQRDLAVIIPAVLLVIFLVLILLLRSILMPALLMLTVVLSFGATLGLGAIFFNNVFDFPGGDPSVPLFAFVFLAALGIDYNIFLMTRAREESLKHGTRPGILKALAVTGGVITSAGIVLAATFSALGVLPILFLAQIAFLVAVGVLIDTLVVRSLLVPSMVMQIGPKSWWPSILSREEDDERELHAALDFHEVVPRGGAEPTEDDGAVEPKAEPDAEATKALT